MLSEPRIQRYARQILLRDVGGGGQEALGATGIRLSGQGPLFEAARTYLEAGGTAVEPRRDGAPWAADAALLDAPPRTWLEVGPASERFVAPSVVVGERAGVIVLWSVGGDGCRECLRAQAPRSSEGVTPSGPAGVVAGGALALLVQRRLLGLGRPLEGLTISRAGGVQRLEVPRCSHHPPALAPAVLAEVLAHLTSTWPEEGCGVLLEGAEGMRFLPLANAQGAHHARDPVAFPGDARRAFTVDPSTWLRLQKDAEARGEALAALVHSHPEGPARFSDEDRRQAAPDGIPLFPGMAHLVVAFRAGVPATAVWALWKAGGFDEVPCPLPGEKSE